MKEALFILSAVLLAAVMWGVRAETRSAQTMRAQRDRALSSLRATDSALAVAQAHLTLALRSQDSLKVGEIARATHLARISRRLSDSATAGAAALADADAPCDSVAKALKHAVRALEVTVAHQDTVISTQASALAQARADLQNVSLILPTARASTADAAASVSRIAEPAPLWRRLLPKPFAGAGLAISVGAVLPAVQPALFVGLGWAL